METLLPNKVWRNSHDRSAVFTVGLVSDVPITCECWSLSPDNIKHGQYFLTWKNNWNSPNWRNKKSIFFFCRCSQMFIRFVLFLVCKPNFFSSSTGGWQPCGAGRYKQTAGAQFICSKPVEGNKPTTHLVCKSLLLNSQIEGWQDKWLLFLLELKDLDNESISLFSHTTKCVCSQLRVTSLYLLPLSKPPSPLLLL